MTIRTNAQFTELYQANYQDVLRFVQRRAHPLVVDDIVGETFTAAWRRRAELPTDARPWLFRTARNAMANAARSANRQTAVAVRIAEHLPATAYDSSVDIDRRLDLVELWRALPAADQEVLSLHVWEQLTDREAATVLGCTRAAYAMRLSRAKRRLAASVDPSTRPISLATSH